MNRTELVDADVARALLSEWEARGAAILAETESAVVALLLRRAAHAELEAAVAVGKQRLMRLLATFDQALALAAAESERCVVERPDLQ